MAKRRDILTPAALAVVVAVLAAPVQAGAATVESDRSCYLQRPDTTVAVRGTDFAPNAPFSVELDGTKLEGGDSVMSADGAMSGSFQPTPLAEDVVQRTYRLTLRTADAAPTTDFTVTRLRASFWPTAGSARTMRVRFSLFGFGLEGQADQVFVHYVSPSGQLRRTSALGRPAGQCGSISKTRKRRLFPFRVTCPGSWRLQFDTRRRYSPGTSKSSFLHYTLKVRVRPAGASASAC